MTTRIITDYLDQAVLSHGDKIAYADEERALTFRQVQEEAHRIAQGLIDAGFFRRPVGIFLDKNTGCLTAMLGTAYSGCFYSVIDTQMPVERIEKIVGTLEPAAVLTVSAYREQVAEFAPEAEILLLEDLLDHPADPEAIASVGAKIMGSDLLYVLFTSGSTGNPKGVMTAHAHVINYIEAVSEAYHLDEHTISGNQTPFYFVMSIVEIFGTLRNCSTMYIIPHMHFAFPALLMKYIEEKQINFLYWVPSALNMVANLNAFDCADISCVKMVSFGGEVMPVRQLNMWRKHLPDTVFINSYGPTEGTDGSTYYVIDREFPETARLPIGIPFKNNEILVLDAENHPIQGKGTGEYCIRSTSLTYGYYRNPEKTAEVYVQNPVNPYFEEKIYRTGDLVEFNEYGELEYVGRKDFQIKHMGHRIELGEIEANVSSISGIDENCCVYDSERQKIVLFYSGKVSDEEVAERLKELLPDYMLPNKRIAMNPMPHNLNGKVDRAELKKLAAQRKHRK